MLSHMKYMVSILSLPSLAMSQSCELQSVSCSVVSDSLPPHGLLEWVAFPISRGSSQPRPGEFNGLYSPWGCKELDTTERLSLLTYHNQVNKRLMHKAEKISLLMYKNCKNQMYLTLVVILLLSSR